MRWRSTAKSANAEVVTSNAGHALFTGIANAERAQLVATRLLDPDSFSGWGIRTVATSAARYNPMSYHNGSIWPHDNALIALGFARYGLKEQALKVFTALIEAAGHIDLNRLPELFCGFARKQRQGPTGYPVACSPQAWAAATPLALIQASLGLSLDHDQREVRAEPACSTGVHRPDFRPQPAARLGRRGCRHEPPCRRRRGDDPRTPRQSPHHRDPLGNRADRSGRTHLEDHARPSA